MGYSEITNLIFTVRCYATSFFIPNSMAIFRQESQNGDVKFRGYEKIAVVNQYLVLSWKRYNIEP